MSHLEKIIAKLPDAERAKIYEELYEAIKWRGCDDHAAQAVKVIADVLCKNGVDILEYT